MGIGAFSRGILWGDVETVSSDLAFLGPASPDYRDLFRCQPVQLVHQRIDPHVRCVSIRKKATEDREDRPFQFLPVSGSR